MNRYRIYGTDNSDYAFGGPLFGPTYLYTLSANNPKEAVEKYYKRSKKHRFGWPKYMLSARSTGAIRKKSKRGTK